jgi:hypothetical protein
LECGHGQFTFPDNKGNRLVDVHQTVSDPFGADCGVKKFTNLIVYTDSEIEELANFLAYLVELSEQCEEGLFACFKWHVRYHYWKKGASCKAGPVESVVLPVNTKTTLLADISTCYELNGIPYRRN